MLASASLTVSPLFLRPFTLFVTRPFRANIIARNFAFLACLTFGDVNSYIYCANTSYCCVSSLGIFPAVYRKEKFEPLVFSSTWHLATALLQGQLSFCVFHSWHLPPTAFWRRINFTTVRVAHNHFGIANSLILCYFAHLNRKNVCLCSVCTLNYVSVWGPSVSVFGTSRPSLLSWHRRILFAIAWINLLPDFS